MTDKEKKEMDALSARVKELADQLATSEKTVKLMSEEAEVTRGQLQGQIEKITALESERKDIERANEELGRKNRELERSCEELSQVAREATESARRVARMAEPKAPSDLGDYKGEWIELKTGKVFGLKKVPNHPAGKTYHVKNAENFGEYTEAEFRQRFEKK